MGETTQTEGWLVTASDNRPLRVAIIGGGPAGIYTADLLTKAERDFEVSIDIFDRYPAPFGLIRYGVAPDHPRIKGIIKALYRVMDRGDIRFFGHVDYGTDLTLADLHHYYDAVVFSTGAVHDATLNIAGAELEGSFGAAEFVNWYDAHPHTPHEWDLSAESIAVIGNGNVALDISRVLAKSADEMLTTEIPDYVYQGLKNSRAKDIHIFGRRGPAQMKFTPLELRELAHSPNVDIVLYPDDFEFDEASEQVAQSNNQIKNMVGTLSNWMLEQEEREESGEDTGATRRLHLHFLQAPQRILSDESGTHVAGIRMQRMELIGDGTVQGTGEFIDYPVQAVYRAIGYFGSPLAGVRFNDKTGTIVHREGRVLDEKDQPVVGLYTSGWIKRGPVGLIGHTKGDALETIGHIIEDEPHLYTAEQPDEHAIIDLLESRGIRYTDWEGWHRLDAHEVKLGEEFSQTAGISRERVKVFSNEEMVSISRQHK
ncbi:FAD-dependent oxidoreductase [Auritidibacter ignavus]|uniref:FAD-dependent oxidoreductase n=1 Tax=Auritidibacter TaxID=1160973 RepID=UPI000D73E1EF|nr:MULTISPECIES: FAD-dependent oxidoreductase [Auritidibacter]AXR72959.1 pyridine nucleotide-disulfide oxidoreductase [Auritidibacter sp. NML130574]WGH81488.1 FAD-dependent oxidoreductase [Auritidibacter ignavus]WGH85216.1 FAD-dependent oxidoreductase [Auritidibacter ignavus]WGH87504.1 FAD-dependent oxidoreductase [Auritidibacter ignavus]